MLKLAVKLPPGVTRRLHQCRHSLTPAISLEGKQSIDSSYSIAESSERTLSHGREPEEGASDCGSLQLACCARSHDEHGDHVHHEHDSSWGPLRTGVFELLRMCKVLQVSDQLSHSFRAALVSCACFLASAALSTGLIGGPAATAGTTRFTAAAGLLATSVCLSGLPAMVDAVVQVCSRCHRGLGDLGTKLSVSASSRPSHR